MKPGRSPLQSYYAKCLQADLPGAIHVLRAARSKKAKALIRKVERRFLSKDEKHLVRCGDQLVEKLVRAYREYYRESLLDLRRRDSFGRSLDGQIRRIAGEFGLSLKKNQSVAAVEKILSAELGRRGYFALFGTVTPLRSLMVWRSEKRRSFRVPLVSGPEKVNVVLLDGFVELGWLHFATFGRHYVGGWAKKNALYCVSQAYKRNFRSEAFRVSYLAHEAQHFSDYKRFPGLSQADLEYRAKLAELVASKRPAKLMRKFSAEARNEPGLPHCYAAFRIMQVVKPGQRGAAISRRASEALAR